MVELYRACRSPQSHAPLSCLGRVGTRAARISIEPTAMGKTTRSKPTQKTDGSKIQARVVSYNVLSERLCHKSEYIACTASSLDTQRRHERIELKLAAEIKEQSIICLQEVTIAFASRLHVFFERAGYHLVHDPYAGRRSGWMGVAVAYPRARYSLSHLLVEEPTDDRWIWETITKPSWRTPRAAIKGNAAIGGMPSEEEVGSAGGGRDRDVGELGGAERGERQQAAALPLGELVHTVGAELKLALSAAGVGMLLGAAATLRLPSLARAAAAAAVIAVTVRTACALRDKRRWEGDITSVAAAPVGGTVSRMTTELLGTVPEDASKVAELSSVAEPAAAFVETAMAAKESTSEARGLVAAPTGLSTDDAYFELLQSVANRLLLCSLCDRESGREFWVANFHMPCKFQNPPAMVTFAALVGQRVQTVAADEPYVLAGDFNFTPSSTMYELLTSGSIPPDHPHYPSARKLRRGKECSWTPSLLPMVSAYVSAKGQEPELTNHATTCMAGGPARTFTGALDYIFLSPGWEATQCVRTPCLASLAGIKSFPIASEPSDHVLIGCSLSHE